MPAWLIPAIIAAVGAGASYLQNRAAGRPAQEQQRLYNAWLNDREKGVDNILAQLAANGQNPFGGQTTTGTSSSATAGTSNSTTRQSTRPVITDEYSKMEGLFRNIMEGRLARPSALPIGYAETGALAINKAHAGTAAAARNIAARRGLSAEAALGLVQPGESARATDIGKFLVDVPLKERELRTDDIKLGSALTQAFGLGSDGVSQTVGSTTSKTAGNTSMTSPANIGMLASLLLPPGPMQGGGSGISPGGMAGGDLAGILMQLFRSGAFSGMFGGSGGGGGTLPPPTTGSGGIF